MKTLVAFFSASGETKTVAERLARIMDADLFEIVSAVPYTNSDLDWTNKKSRSSVEMADSGSRPAIADRVRNMEDYDRVFIGFPIWWYVPPKIVNTFIEDYDFSDKTMIPFATSGGSGLGKAVETLKALCPKTTVFKAGKIMNRASEAELRSWLESLGQP